MKATDLMIGDWVAITEPDDYRGYIGKVKIINNETGYITVFIKDGHLHDVLIDDLQPIPLTPEILEKNGWELTKTASSKHYWHDDVPFHIPIEPYHHWRGDEDRIFADDFFDSVFIRLCYVHELQHALKLCGIEKEIIL